MELVDVQPGAPALGAVADHSVPHLVYDDHHAERAQLSGQAAHVEHGEPVGQVDVGLAVEAAQGARRVRAERDGELVASGLAGLLQGLLEVGERGLVHAGAVVPVPYVQAERAPVDEALLDRVEAGVAADEGADHGDHVVGLVLDGVAVAGLLHHDVERVDAAPAAGADLDDLAAERLREGQVLAFGVDDDDLVVAVEEQAGDLLLDGEALAAAGRAEDEPVRVHVAAPVGHDRVAAPGVAAVEQAAGLEHLLRGEGDQDRGRVRGQGAGHGQRVAAQGQFGRQALQLHELEALGLAGLRVDLRLDALARDVELLLAVGGHADHGDRVDEPLVGLAQLVAQLAHLGLLVGEVVGQVVGVEALLAVLSAHVHDLHLDLGVLLADDPHALAAVERREVDAHVDARADRGQVVDELVGQLGRQVADPERAVQEAGVKGLDAEHGRVARVDAPRAHEVLGGRAARHPGERALVEPERLAGAQDLRHEAQPVLPVEARGVAFVDRAHLRGEAVAQRVERADRVVLVGFADGDGQCLDGVGVAADRFELARDELVVVGAERVERVAVRGHADVGQDVVDAARARARRDLERLAGVEAVDELGPPVDDLHLVALRAQLVVDVGERDRGAPPVVAQVGDAVAQHGVVADELLDGLRHARRTALPPLFLGFPSHFPFPIVPSRSVSRGPPLGGPGRRACRPRATCSGATRIACTSRA